MKKKNGFTLIELLAVIVILAIIALIATPIILNLINEARKGAAKDSAYGVKKTSQLYYQQILLSDESGIRNDILVSFNNETINIQNGKENIEFNLDGTKPSDGEVTITTEGKVSGEVVINGFLCTIPVEGKITCEKANSNITYEIQNSSKWTQSKTLALTFDNSCTDKAYSLNNGTTWNNYTEALTITDNVTVKAKCSNDDIKDIVVSQIDNETVVLNSIPFSTKATSRTITITVNDPEVGASGIKEYGFSIDNGATWVNQVSKVYVANVEAGTYPVKVRVYNNTYEESMSAEEKAKASAESEVQNITTATLTEPEITYSPEYGTWTQSRVITIDYHGLDYKKYSYDGTTWNDYTEILIMNNNGNIYIKYGFNENEAETQTIVEDRIDNSIPQLLVTANPTTNSITINANVSNNPSGIKYYDYSIDGGSNYLYTNEITDSKMIESLSTGTYTPAVRIYTNSWYNTADEYKLSNTVVTEIGSSYIVQNTPTPTPTPIPLKSLSIVQVGDYISMTPSSEPFEIDSDMTGYTPSTIMEIDPQELNLWRVIRKNSNGTIDMVSVYVNRKSIYFEGATGYKNCVGYLNTLASYYENPLYTVGSRHVGYDRTKATETLTSTKKYDGSLSSAPWTATTSSSTTAANEKIGAGDMGYQTDYNLLSSINATSAKIVGVTGSTTRYWFASRKYIYISSSGQGLFGIRTAQNDGEYSATVVRYTELNNTFTRSSDYAYIRPIVTLDSNVKISGGDGKTESTAYTLST